MIVCRHCGERLDDDARFCGGCGAALEDAIIGRIVGNRYRIIERIGVGSLGIVYRAEQVGLGRKLAIKLLSPESKRDPTTVERFRQEGAVLARLRSPHTVTTYEVGTEPDGSFYIAMELSVGRSLGRLLHEQGPLSWERVLRIMAGICDSLGEAHELGVIHRGLSLETVLVETRGMNRDFVRILDFGLAKLVASDVRLSPVGQTVGAVEYSSPEQLLREPVDARSDLYALGVLGYVLVTGAHPFQAARSFGDMVAAHIKRTPPPASTVVEGLPAEVDAILSRCLEKKKERRYPDALALAGSIGVALSTLAANQGDTMPEPEIDLDAEIDMGEEDTAIARPRRRPPT
ncbi:MAG: serine/threonine-protein kinase [Kofleriaceae bacterium]